MAEQYRRREHKSNEKPGCATAMFSFLFILKLSTLVLFGSLLNTEKNLIVPP